MVILESIKFSQGEEGSKPDPHRASPEASAMYVDLVERFSHRPIVELLCAGLLVYLVLTILSWS